MSPEDSNLEHPATDEPPSDTEQLREEIAETREELGETVEALAQKADVKAQVSEKKEEAKAKVEGLAAKVGEAQAKLTQAPQVQQGLQQAKERPVVPIAAAAVIGLLVIGLVRRRRRSSW